MTNRILFVDDDPNLLAAFQRNLRKQFNFDTAPGGPEAIELIKKGEPYAVVVADMRMPGMDGVRLLEQVRQITPDSVRIMLTGNADQQTAVDAVNRGQIFRFLNKPCPPDQLVPTLESALKQYEIAQIERELLEGTLAGSVKALADVLGMVAPEAQGRGQVLRDCVKELAGPAGATPVWELEIAARLSPIGFASVPTSVLRKQAARAKLTFEEENMVRRVPQVGHDLLAGIPRLEGVAKIILYQHKHFNGGGFPSDFCSGKDIPIGARLLGILNDRLTLEHEGIVREHARTTMQERKGLYDPQLLELCFTTFPALLAKGPPGARPPITVSIAELAPGQLLAQDIATPAGLVLVGSGNRLTPMMVERLRNLAELGEVSEPFKIHDVPLGV